eukprot:784869-Amorphochlora_amoeboformis.AAC.1
MWDNISNINIVYFPAIDILRRGSQGKWVPDGTQDLEEEGAGGDFSVGSPEFAKKGIKIDEPFRRKSSGGV